MNFSQSFKMAMKSIFSNKKRSFLTMLGIIIGVASVIGIVGIISGATNSVTEQFDGIGVNLLTVSLNGRSNGNRRVTYSKLLQFEKENEDVISAVLPSLSGNVVMKYQNESERTGLEGITAKYEEVRNTSVEKGRFITELDVEQKKNVVLIGSYIENEYFPNGDAVGKEIKINGEVYYIVGVVEEKSTGTEGSIDNRVYIPYTSAVRLLKNANISSFSVQAKTTEDINEATQRLEKFLYGVYSDEDAYYIINQKEILDMLEEMLDIMTAMMAGVAGISLIVGGIGIMNIMLVSVTERTREIGIRKAIGASKKSIMVQFLVEAGIISAIGGIIGVLLGVLIVNIGGKIIDVEGMVTIKSMSIAFFFSIGIGMFFGWSPANKAANLRPIDALRTE